MRYIVSNYGRVWDTFSNQFVPSRFNKPYNPDGTNNGYLLIHLAYYITADQIGTKDVYVHRTVLLSFNYIPGCEYLEVNHKNGNKTINALYNLEWVTRKENIDHAINNGLVPLGEDRINSTLTNEQVHYICKRLEAGVPMPDIAKETGVNYKLITDIKYGKIYKFISRNYTMPGSKIVNDKLDESVIHEICKRLEAGQMPTEISRALNVGRYIVNDIKAKKNYTYISCNYNIPDFVNKEYPKKVIHEVCKCLQAGWSNELIVKRLNVSEDLISSIKSKRVHTDISSQYNIPDPKQYKAQMSEAEVRRICEMLQAGMAPAVIAKQVGTHLSTVSNIKLRKRQTKISKDYVW